VTDRRRDDTSYQRRPAA